VSTGHNLATGLKNPQGLGFDGARNILVTESDAGRLDLVVRTFALAVPSGTVQLQPGQPVCVGILRAPGYAAGVSFHEVVGAAPAGDPGAGNQGQVVPSTCNQPACTVTLDLHSNDGDEFARFTYRD
jgi:hypothetical protein